MSPVWVLCLSQTALAAVAGCIAWGVSGSAAAIAALFGGLTAIVPALYFGMRVGLRPRVQRAGQVLGAFYRAEVVKLALTVVMFAIGAKVFGKQFLPLMLTFVGCIAMNWVLVALAKQG